jgi:hypothetical protein
MSVKIVLECLFTWVESSGASSRLESVPIAQTPYMPDELFNPVTVGGIELALFWTSPDFTHRDLRADASKLNGVRSCIESSVGGMDTACRQASGLDPGSPLDLVYIIVIQDFERSGIYVCVSPPDGKQPYDCHGSEHNGS